VIPHIAVIHVSNGVVAPSPSRRGATIGPAVDPALRRQIESGTYEVDPRRVAGAMVARLVARRRSAVLVPAQALDGKAVAAQEGKPRPVVDQA
jgi:hypothetical protein